MILIVKLNELKGGKKKKGKKINRLKNLEFNINSIIYSIIQYTLQLFQLVDINSLVFVLEVEITRAIQLILRFITLVDKI